MMTEEEVIKKFSLRRVRAAFKKRGLKPIRGRTRDVVYYQYHTKIVGCCMIAVLDEEDTSLEHYRKLGLTQKQVNLLIAGWDFGDCGVSPKTLLEKHAARLARILVDGKKR